MKARKQTAASMTSRAKTAARGIVAAVGLGVFPLVAHAQIANPTVDLLRAPSGSITTTFIDQKNDTVIYSNAVSGSNWTLKINHAPPFTLPHAYKDAHTGIIFFVESDGRHVVALDQDGKILWSRQPALDGSLPHYSEKYPHLNPAIVWIGGLREESGRKQKTGSGKFIGIAFNSRQAGFLDVKTGDFVFGGQD